MRIAVFGAGGLVGSHAARFFRSHGHTAIAIGRRGAMDLIADATDPAAVQKALAKAKPDAIINAIKCRMPTDRAETAKNEAWLSNVVAAENLAAASAKLGAKLVHISSAWVYEGKEGESYTEESITYPLNFYAYTKAIAEERVLRHAPNAIVLRPDCVFGEDPRLADFFSRLKAASKKGEKFPAAQGQFSQPIFAGEIARLSEALLASGASGMFNCVGPDYLSRHSLAITMCGLFGFDKSAVVPAPHSARAIRVPLFLRLDISKMNSVCKVQSLDAQLSALKQGAS